MSKARKKSYKPGMLKKLARESFVLSSTRFVSSRVVRFFETGAASPLFSSVKTVDGFVSENITGPIFKKLELRKNFSMPARNAVASFLSRNSIMKTLASLRVGFLNSSLRSVGLFLLTFGIYAAAVFLLKRYVDMPLIASSTDDLIVAALSFVAGLLISLFGDKSILVSFGGSKMIGSLTSEFLGVNPSSINKVPPKRSKVAVGISMLLGSASGALTLFFTPASVLFAVLGAVVTVVVFNIPEFGLLLSVATVAVLPVSKLASLVAISLISYFVKCIRLKRNLRFGTADAFVLVLFAVQLIACVVSGNNTEKGEIYFLLFTAVYFAVKNLIVSEKLIKQAFNSLCLGIELAMCVYIINEFHGIIPHTVIRNALGVISDFAPDANMLAMMVSLVMPFALASFSSAGTRRRNLKFILLAVACAVVSDSFLFYVLLTVSIFVYIAVAYKAPFGAVLGAVVTMPPLFMLAWDITDSKAVIPFANAIYDASLANDEIKSFFWQGLEGVGGVVTVILFAAALLFIVQRPFACVVSNNSPRSVLVCGTVSASAIMLMTESFMFNPFGDLRAILLMWVLLGLCGSAYKVYYNYQGV